MTPTATKRPIVDMSDARPLNAFTLMMRTKYAMRDAGCGIEAVQGFLRACGQDDIVATATEDVTTEQWNRVLRAATRCCTIEWE